MKKRHPMTMKRFFAREDVKDLQEIQKKNPWGSEAHRRAYDKLNELVIQACGKTLGQLGNPY
jgi:hypothetical protein